MAVIFFVCGAPKSGTTWLQKMLDEHPEVVCSGEGHFIERLVTPMLAVKTEYNKQLALVAERVYQGKPYYAPLENNDIGPLARAFILKLMTKRATPETKAIGAKTPRYTEFLPHLMGLFPEARIIDIVRDPRDVAVSRLNHALRAGYGDALTSGSDTYKNLVGNSVDAWNKAQALVDQFRQARPDRLLQLHYEALLSTPAAEAARAFAYLGVSTDAAVIDKVVQATSFEALSGRPRGQEDKTSFFRKGVVGDWVGVLDQPAVDAIVKNCEPWFSKAGYAAGEVQASKSSPEPV